MAIPKTGSISFSDLQAEFGGSNPISLSEYYNAGSYVPSTPNSDQNSNIPTTGKLQISNFLGSSKTASITYEIIGGGGGGGYGKEAGTGSGRGGNGGASSIVLGATTITSAAGGVGGLNGQYNGIGHQYWWVGAPGESSYYGAGGAAGAEQGAGGNASGYGAGGGGAGGDYGNNAYDNDGAPGHRGLAGIRTTGLISVQYGLQLAVTIGAGGAGGTGGDWNGGAGRQGYCKLTYNGFTRIITTTSTVTIN
jgi:hypothetical protein